MNRKVLIALCVIAVIIFLSIVIIDKISALAKKSPEIAKKFITDMADKIESSFPEYAKKEIVYEQYKELIQEVDKIIDESDSFYSAAARMEKISQPDNLLYVGLKDENGEEEEIIKNFEWSSHSTTIFSGTGHGTVSNVKDTRKIIIIERPIDTIEEIKSCIIYLEKE